MGSIIKNDKTRKYIYGAIAAAIPVAVAVGILTEEQAVTIGSSILGLAAALLAVPNTKADAFEPDSVEGLELAEGLDEDDDLGKL